MARPDFVHMAELLLASCTGIRKLQTLLRADSAPARSTGSGGSGGGSGNGSSSGSGSSGGSGTGRSGGDGDCGRMGDWAA